jgi:translation initiation factor 3 subunit B
MFIEFETAEQATLAVKLIDGFKMDKSHTLAVNRFTDVEKYSNVEEEFHAPPEEEFIEKVYVQQHSANDTMNQYKEISKC